MDAKRLENEISAARAEIESLSRTLTDTQNWLNQLVTAAAVLQKLYNHDASPPSEIQDIKLDAVSELSAENSDVPTPWNRLTSASRNAIIKKAGTLLMCELESCGIPIKQKEAVRLLREKYGVLIGGGVPGRETSDLSAALGSGKFPPIFVTRSNGWALTKWSANRGPRTVAVVDDAPNASSIAESTSDANGSGNDPLN